MKDSKICSITKTGVFKGAIISAIAGLVLFIYPSISNIIYRRLDTETAKQDLKDIENIVIQICGFIATGGSSVAIIDRVKNQAKVYTPRNIPGPNIEDLV